jgi:hypothetical protein
MPYLILSLPLSLSLITTYTSLGIIKPTPPNIAIIMHVSFYYKILSLQNITKTHPQNITMLHPAPPHPSGQNVTVATLLFFVL